MADKTNPIAIIGSSCRFAGGASSPSKLWNLLLHPRDLSAPPPSNRFHLPAFYHENGERRGHTNVCGSYFLEQDPRTFDSVFFNISPKEAEAIDPQQRMLLEVTYEAIESAGLTLKGLQGSDTSVYVGLMIRDYMDIQARDPDYFSQYMVTGTSSALNANRISYFFDWRGPSLTIDTACSSSLVAVHQAVQGLRTCESRIACVAATNLLLGPELFISAANMHMVSPRSRMWDASADGYARGDGIATLVLKTLSNAIADGDHIEAIIRQTGVNSDGRTQGITLPNPEAQTALIRETYRRAALDISRAEHRPQFFEAHGTGTQAGDPMEASAIHQAFFGEDILQDEATPLWVGSIKTVVGHTEGTAGLAGILKAMLAMKHRIIPPNLHFHKLNPRIAPLEACMRVPTEPIPWPQVGPGVPLRASVNSFGFGGTNAHVILESYEPAPKEIQPEIHETILTTPIFLSAHSEQALQTMIKDYSSYLKTHGKSAYLRDLSYTLRSRRSVLPVKAFFAGTSAAEIAVDMDKRILSGRNILSQTRSLGSKPSILGVFTGQGAHWPGMGKHLLESSRLFNETIDSLDRILAFLPDAPQWSLRSEILAPKSKSRLGEAGISQPICTAIAIALVDLLRASGIAFTAVVGHSSGEIGAAYAAGVLDASEAIRVAYYRGVHAKLAGFKDGVQNIQGGMIAIGANLDDAKELCNLPRFVGRLQIAASNSSSSITLSGDLDAVREVKELLDAKKIFARQLQVDTAYHSVHMEPCAEPYMASLRACNIRASEPGDVDCAWISSVYGSEGAPTACELGSRYWKDNMVRTVLFHEALERALVECGPFDVAIEVGPHPALKGPASKTIDGFFDDQIPYLGTLDRRKNDVVAFGEALASLWILFGPEVVDFEGYITASEPVGLPPPVLIKDDLPSYPWDHSQLLWRESRLSREYRMRASPSHELLGSSIPGGNSEDHLSWRNLLLLHEMPWIGQHRVQGIATVPTSALCALAIEAGMKLAAASGMAGLVEVVEIQTWDQFHHITVPNASDGVELITSIERLVTTDDDASFTANVSIRFGPPDGSQPLKKAVSGLVALFSPTSPVCNDLSEPEVLEDLLDIVKSDDFYSSMCRSGLDYQGPFQILQNIRRKWRYSTALLSTSSEIIPDSLVVDPFLIESCIQGTYAALAAPCDPAMRSCFTLSKFQRLSVNLNLLTSCDVPFKMHSRIIDSINGRTSSGAAAFSADIEILDRSGRAMIEFEGLKMEFSSIASENDDDREVFLQKIWKRNISDGTCFDEKHAHLEAIADACKEAETHAVSLRDRPRSNASHGTSSLAILRELFPDHAGNEAPSVQSVLQAVVEQHPLFSRSISALGTLLDQVSHRFADLDVLELGPLCLGSSRQVFEGLKTPSSYTFAGPKTPEVRSGHDIRFVSLEFSASWQDEILREFREQASDVVIVSYALHGQTVEFLEKALIALRQIITPGGFLLLIEPVEDYVWSRLFLDALHAEIDDTENSRDLGAPLSTVDLDRSLRRSGFGGIDTQLPTSDDPSSAISIFLAQAVEENIDMMRHPLQPSALSILDGRKLFVVGGRTLQTRNTTQSIVSLLGQWASQIIIAESFDDLEIDLTCASAGAIVLADIDCPVVESLSPQAYGMISHMFRHLPHILWATSGAMTDASGQAASFGLVQSLSEQYPSCRAQLLDVDNLDSSVTNIVASFLRLLISSLPERENNDRFRTIESQIAIRDGCELVPRVLPVRDMNDRLNSQRRVIKKQLQKDTPVSFTPSGSLLAATYHAEPIKTTIEDPIVVSHSLPFATKVSEGNFFYLFAGTDDANEPVIGLSTTLSLPGQASATWKVPQGIDTPRDRILELASSIVVARSICDLLPAGESVIYEPSRILASLVSDFTRKLNKKVRFMTSESVDSAEKEWICVSPHATKSAICSAIAHRPKLFLDLSGGSSRLSTRIRQSLSPEIKFHDLSEIFSLSARTSEDMTASRLEQMLRGFSLSALEESRRMLKGLLLPRIQPDVLLDKAAKYCCNGLGVVDWTQVTSIPTTVESLQAASFLSCHKTYVLIEIETRLLQSISHWFVSCGVSSLLIIDRSPVEWRGRELPPQVSVRFARTDLTEMSEVSSLVNGIPDIGGVIYGGVGSHKSCADEELDIPQSWKSMMQASQNISQALMARNPDFFIILSSTDKEHAPVTAYLSSLVPQVRFRGLAASFVNLDAEWKYAEKPEKSPYMRISESDMHYILTEAILAATSRSHDPIVLAGIKRIDRADAEASTHWPWLLQPLFSHHTVRPGDPHESSGQKQTHSLQERLDMCRDNENASAAILDFFLSHLAGLLNLVRETIRPEDDLASFGVDSLSASDIRAWFLKEVDADIPMVRILGGTSIAHLCDEAAGTRTFDMTGAATAFETPETALPSRTCELPASEAFANLGSSNLDSGRLGSDTSGGVSPPILSQSVSGDSENFFSPEAVSTPVSASLDESHEGEYCGVQKIEKQSLNQTRFWFPSLCLNQKTPFNCTTSYSLNGPIDAARLEIAFKLLIQRHETFRTAFFNDKSNGEPMQQVLPASPFALQVKLGNKTENYEKEFRRIHDYVFDLASADTFIASIISHSRTEHTIITGYHHMIMDGVSWQITLRDLARFYELEKPQLPPLSQYADFAIKQRRAISQGCHAQKLAFWKKEFSVAPAAMPLFPFAKTRIRKSLTSYETRDVVLDVKASLVARIKKASSGVKSTSFHFYLAAFVVLANRCLEMNEICLGIVDANRSDKAFMNTIGCFIDMLPMKLNVNSKERFSHTISNVRKKAYSALEHSGVPLETLIQELQIPASPTANPMFQVLINYRLGALRAPQIGDAEMEFLAYEDSKAPFDLTLSIDEKDDGTGMLTFSMQEYMYDHQGAQLLVSTYVHLLEILSDDPSQRLHEIPLANESASSTALVVGTGPTLDIGWPLSQTMSQRVDSQAQEHPQHLAVKDLSGRSRTYLATLRRVNALALALIKAGVTHGSRVASYCEPTVDVVACILATHRVGALFIPLDLRNSPERLGAMVDECGPTLILCDQGTRGQIYGFAHADISILDISTVPESADIAVPNASRLSDGAFILYTSGSTGRPKGILLTQANISIHCASISNKLKLTHEDVFLQQSALGFDAALGQMLYAMTSGGALILGDNRGDPRDLAMLMETEKITFTLMIISEITALLQSAGDILARCTAWRFAVCGGEAFPGRLLSKFRCLGLPDLAVYNAYGPTEGTIITSIGAVSYRDETWGEETTIPCGPPLPHYGVYVLDDQSRPVPLGWPGELCIAGPCISSGYVGQPALTAARFKPVCLNRPEGGLREGWDKIYRTGDRARLLDDGSFVFLGRINGDTQVKLRGFRIELGEITSAIIKASEGVITDAVSIVRGTTDQMLVSFVVFERSVKEQLGQGTASIAYLRNLVQNLPLPIYMRPAIAIPLDRLPMTARGKLDTEALAAYELSEDVEEEEEEQLTETEEKLKNVWKAALPGNGLGIQIRKTSDFFSVGGNSLLLIRLRAAIGNAFGVGISLADLFHASTLESLAGRIDCRSPNSHQTQKIDWKAEMTLDATLPIAKTVRHLMPTPSEQPITVILTGSTGFLGREIVRHLIGHPLIARVHCVAVRQGRSLPASDKLVVHNGDLSARFLGLSEADAQDVFSTASAIIHNGAEVSHMKTYQTLRSTNVESTRQLIELALRTANDMGAPVPSFHFISSAGVGGLAIAPEFPEMSVVPYPPAAEEPNGYIAAKYVSECLLESASRRLGLPVTIHRPSNISGPGVQDRDIVHSIWRWSERMRAAPDLVAAGATGAFDFVGVNTCAAGIVSSVFNGLREAGGHSVSYVHQSGDEVVCFENFVEVLEERLGASVALWPFDEWVERAVEMGLDELVAGFLRQTGGALLMPLLIKR